MSVNMDMDADEVDYSDFEYQFFNGSVFTEGASDDSNNNVTGFHEFSPLSPIGGLDNNEVAELVYLETQVSLEFEQEAGDQNVGSATETRGVIGANLPTSGIEGLLNPGGQPTNSGVIAGGSPNFDDADGETRVDNRVFQQFRADGAPAFDDQTNGPGGGADAPNVVYEKNFRELTGRGPVLDQTDDMTIIDRLVTADTVIQERSNIRLHMVWDVAEVDEAGREFSIPV